MVPAIRLSRLSHLLWAAIAIVGMAVVAVGITVWQLRTDAIDNAVRDTGNLATILADQLGQSVSAIDVGLLELESRLVELHSASPENYPAEVRSEAMFRQLTRIASRLPQARAVAIVNTEGHIINTSRGWPSQDLDVSDREYFFNSKLAPEGLHVGLPMTSDVIGDVLIFFSRAVRTSKGELIGIVEIGMPISHFERIYQSISSLPGVAFLFTRADGTILSRYPGPKLRPGEIMPKGSPWHAQVANGGGYYHSPGYASGEPRIVSVRLIPGYPFVADVALTEAAALATWQQRTLVISAGGALVLMCIVALVLTVVRQLRMLTEREAKLHDKTRELEAAHRIVDAALNHMSQGLCMIDSEGRVAMANERYYSLYRVPPSLAKAGIRLADLLADRKLNGDFGGDPDSFVAQLLHMLRSGRRVHNHARLADGRMIAVHNEPLTGGGWVATHEDITERLRLEKQTAEQAEQLREGKEALRIQNARFEAAIENMAEGLCMFDSDEKLVVWNQRFIRLYNFRPDFFKVGMTYREIVIHRITGGMPGRGECDPAIEEQVESLRRFARDRSTSRIVELGDGRLIRILRYPLNTGGWVDTHEDITERHRHETKIAFMAHHDLLTGLANRTFFTEKIEDAVARLQRHNERFAIFMLDLDKFKNVNDTLGHAAGDQLLRETAKRLKASLRATDVLARLGGDEFAIIQANHENIRDDAASLAARIVELLSRPFEIDGNTVSVGTSVGIAVAPDDASDSKSLLKMADLALYAVKSSGRNGFRFFDAGLLEENDHRNQLESDLRGAIARSEFELHYQPVIDVRTRRPAGFEALVRWRHPTRGLLYPGAFMPVAEETGLIVPLGNWIFHRACEEAVKWPANPKVSINVSPAQLTQPDFLDVVLLSLAETQLPPERVEVEVTESLLLKEEDNVTGTLRQLKNLGVTIALDDFGTGYSSLSYLTMFPFDRIKIDRSFISNLTSRADCAAIVYAVLALGKALDREVVAEGVETEQQLRLLEASGVNLVQGFLFGEARPASEIEFGELRPEIVKSAA